MPANSKHVKVVDLAKIWKRLRDVVAGEDAVKKEGTDYLPMLSGQEQSDYSAYKTRATFYAATGRTVDGLQGAIQRKSPDLEWPPADLERLKNIGRAGESFDEMSGVSIRECLTVGRLGLLVDAPTVTDGLDYAAYVTLYFAEDIINWRQEVVRGRKVTTMVVLAEQVERIDPKDVFKVVSVPQWRVLYLGRRGAYDLTGTRIQGFTKEDMDTGFYYQEVWQEDPTSEDKTKLVLVERTTPRHAGGRLFTEIPFSFINPSDNGPDPHEPPLNDLASLNLSHYRTSADLEHGRHFTALPTPWFAGFKLEGVVKIGSGIAYATDDPQAKAGMLEFTGAGLNHLHDAIEEKERQMATLGSRLLESQKADAEAAAAIAMRTVGEQSALALISKTLSEAWTQVLRWLWSWDQSSDAGTDKISVEFNTEFGISQMSGPQMTAMMAAVQGGLMSFETWFYNLQRAEIIPEGIEIEEERTNIEAGLPAALGLILGPGGGGPPNPNAAPLSGSNPPPAPGAKKPPKAAPKPAPGA